MAAPIAYEQPSISSAWQAFLAHVPVLLVTWGVTIALSLIGSLVGFLIALLATALGNASPAASADQVSTLAVVLAQIGQFPFTVLSSFVGVLFFAVPAIHYETGAVVTIHTAYRTLTTRPLRYLLAGLLFSVAAALGFLFCLLPGIAIGLIGPVYVNRIFNTDSEITDAFRTSFQSVFRSPRGWTFIGVQLLAFALVFVLALCTCGIGALLGVPLATFYIQNTAYHEGILS